MEKKYFHQTALDYVFKLQEVNETKKFEFVETVSTCSQSKTVPIVKGEEGGGDNRCHLPNFLGREGSHFNTKSSVEVLLLKCI